jgi:hypothetical protein
MIERECEREKEEEKVGLVVERVKVELVQLMISAPSILGRACEKLYM